MKLEIIRLMIAGYENKQIKELTGYSLPLIIWYKKKWEQADLDMKEILVNKNISG
jgi:hypothetical protein